VRNQRETITKALETLTAGLLPYVEREMKAVLHDEWFEAAQSSFRKDRGKGVTARKDVIRWDVHSLLTVLWDQWNRVFRNKLGQAERSLISELRDFRNRWAHQEQFNFDDTYRILDSIERILKAVGAKESHTVSRQKENLLRERFSEEAEAAIHKAEDRRKKWRDVGIYTICCLAVVIAIGQSFGPKGWLLSGFISIVFAYFAYERVVTPPRIYFGAHECARCSKIIYSQECPYCSETGGEFS